MMVNFILINIVITMTIIPYHGNQDNQITEKKT